MKSALAKSQPLLRDLVSRIDIQMQVRNPCHFRKVHLSHCMMSYLYCRQSSHHHPSSPINRRPIPSGLLLLRRKPQTNAINTMPLIRRRRVSLSFEYMPQMSTTFRANNLCPLHTEGAVRMPSHSAWDRIEVCRPAAAGLELVGCAVERCFTGCAFLWGKVSGTSLRHEEEV